MTAATPLGTNCCAHTRQPLPMPIIRTPSSACPRHESLGGSPMPRIRRTSARMRPATKWRDPAIANGGMLSIATRVARKVVPQDDADGEPGPVRAPLFCLGELVDGGLNAPTIQQARGNRTARTPRPRPDGRERAPAETSTAAARRAPRSRSPELSRAGGHR